MYLTAYVETSNYMCDNVKNNQVPPLDWGKVSSEKLLKESFMISNFSEDSHLPSLGPWADYEISLSATVKILALI